MKFQLVEVQTYFPMRFFLYIEIEMVSILYVKRYDRSRGKQKKIHFGLSSKPNFDIDGIAVSM